MIVIFSLLLAITFSILSGFHLYWLFGGVYGLNKAVPTVPGKEAGYPPKFATLTVALVLALFSYEYYAKVFEVESLLSWLEWLIPLLFFIRAIGEFKYVGFFKSVKHTEFAKADTKLFSPLCLLISIVGIVVYLKG